MGEHAACAEFTTPYCSDRSCPTPLIVTFIFADATFNIVDSFVGDAPSDFFNATTISACLIGVVGAASIWISFFYMRKSEAMREWIVLCAWSQKIKSGRHWITITEFLSDTLGYKGHLD